MYLNVSKTKVICVEFRNNGRDPKPVRIKGEVDDRVNTYNYLGVIF